MLTGSFRLITTIAIRVLFNNRSKKIFGKQRIKNTISFKSLNYVCGINLIMVSILHVQSPIGMSVQSYKTFKMYYTVSFTINLTLAILIFSDKDSRAFLKRKFDIWIDQKRLMHSKFRQSKVGPMQI